MDFSRSQVPLDHFFTGLAEYTFQTRLGVVDPPLVDYIARLLTRFIHSDAIYKLRNPVGGRLYELVEMLVEAEARVGEAKREVHRHVGDLALFWTGVYPEALRQQSSKARFDVFVDYCRQGKRAYHLAASTPTAERPEENEVLERLSHEFDLCAYGLQEMRREWEKGEGRISKPE
jgi:hypothetical protein